MILEVILLLGLVSWIGQHNFADLKYLGVTTEGYWLLLIVFVLGAILARLKKSWSGYLVSCLLWCIAAAIPLVAKKYYCVEYQLDHRPIATYLKSVLGNDCKFLIRMDGSEYILIVRKNSDQTLLKSIFTKQKKMKNEPTSQPIVRDVPAYLKK